MADDPARPPGALHSPRPCPICRRPSSARNHPFCTPRCAEVDLHRWLVGSYAIPAEEEDAPGEDDEAGEAGGRG
jgi:endogenous inhibitor of DNA gyrase (YacG/DUF329 family)